MSKILSPIFGAGNDMVLVCISFLPNGSSNPVSSGFTGVNEISSITRTGAGAFLIKFAEAYPQLISKWADIALNAVADLKCQFGTYTPATTTLPPPFSPAQIVLTVLAVATPTDVAANANNRISCGFVFRRTSVET